MVGRLERQRCWMRLPYPLIMHSPRNKASPCQEQEPHLCASLLSRLQMRAEHKAQLAAAGLADDSDEEGDEYYPASLPPWWVPGRLLSPVTHTANLHPSRDMLPQPIVILEACTFD